MGKWKDFINKHKPPKRTFKEWVKAIVGYLKRPKFLIPCVLTYLLIMSPSYISATLYFMTKENGYLIFASSYYGVVGLTVFPIPVVPISIASGIFFEKILNKQKVKK